MSRSRKCNFLTLINVWYDCLMSYAIRKICLTTTENTFTLINNFGYNLQLYAVMKHFTDRFVMIMLPLDVLIF